MRSIAELLAAVVVGLAAATFAWFGLGLESSEAESQPRVKRISASAPAVLAAPRVDSDRRITA